MDFRREWVIERVSMYLGLSSEDNQFAEMIANGDDEDLEDNFNAFLDDEIYGEDTFKRVFTFYRTSYTKLTEKEIMVEEIGNFKFT